MWLLLGLLGVALVVGRSNSGRTKVVPPPVPSGPPGVVPPLFAPSVSLTTGVVYQFAALSNLTEEAFQLALSDVGADLTAFSATTLATGDMTDGYAGMFVWNGAEGEPVEDLPGITWLLVLPVAPTVAGLSHGTRYGAIGVDGLDLSGVDAEAWGQASWQNIHHGAGQSGYNPNAPSAGSGGGTLSRSGALPFEPMTTMSPQRAALEGGAGHAHFGPRIPPLHEPAPHAYHASPQVAHANAMREMMRRGR